MLGIAPVYRIGKYSFEPVFIGVVFYASSAMIKMKVGKKHIGDIRSAESGLFQSRLKCIITMKIIMGKKFSILLISNSVIDKYQPVSIFDQQATHAPGTHVV